MFRKYGNCVLYLHGHVLRGSGIVKTKSTLFGQIAFSFANNYLSSIQRFGAKTRAAINFSSASERADMIQNGRSWPNDSECQTTAPGLRLP